MNLAENKSIKFHIDVNSAFLSWTAIKLLKEGNPVDIRTVPAIVGGDPKTRHGIVVAKSLPAKALGIHTADTVASALKKCPDLIMVPPDHPYYKRQSRALMKHLSDICPMIEQVSIDECYMAYEPLREQYPDPLQAAYHIKNSVRDTFGFTVNVGISDKKVLAKMASDFEKPDKLHTLFSDEISKKLWPLPISDLHMCGKSSAARFRQYGIHTIGDLAKTDPDLVTGWMKSHGKLLWNYANGIDNDEVITEQGPAKGVGNSVTLSKNVTDFEGACTVLKELSDSVSGRLTKKRFEASQISVEIKYATFTSVSHQMTVDKPICKAEDLYRNAVILFKELWNGEAVRLLGIRTTKLERAGAPKQLTIEDYLKQQQVHLQKKEEEAMRIDQKKEKARKLEEALDKVRSKYGKDMIRKGL